MLPLIAAHVPHSTIGSQFGRCKMQDGYNTKKSPLHLKDCPASVYNSLFGQLLVGGERT